MNAFEATLRMVKRDLTALKVRWALVGGLAVAARGAPRTTNDIDIAVAAESDAEAERICGAFMRLGYTVGPQFEGAEGLLTTVRFLSPHARSGEIWVDLLFSPTGIESEIVSMATSERVLNITLPVARAGHLIAMKLVSMSDLRAKDVVDLQALLPVVAAADVALAREALRAIELRGLRGKPDLEAALDRLLAFPSPHDWRERPQTR